MTLSAASYDYVRAVLRQLPHIVWKTTRFI